MKIIKKILKLFFKGLAIGIGTILLLILIDSTKLYNSPNGKHRLLVIKEFRVFAMPGDGGACSKSIDVILLNRFFIPRTSSYGKPYSSGSICDLEIDWQLQDNYVNYNKARGFDLKEGKFEY